MVDGSVNGIDIDGRQFDFKGLPDIDFGGYYASMSKKSTGTSELGKTKGL